VADLIEAVLGVRTRGFDLPPGREAFTRKSFGQTVRGFRLLARASGLSPEPSGEAPGARAGTADSIGVRGKPVGVSPEPIGATEKVFRMTPIDSGRPG
jgi:hypothetical protein